MGTVEGSNKPGYICKWRGNEKLRQICTGKTNHAGFVHEEWTRNCAGFVNEGNDKLCRICIHAKNHAGFVHNEGTINHAGFVDKASERVCMTNVNRFVHVLVLVGIYNFTCSWCCHVLLIKTLGQLQGFINQHAIFWWSSYKMNWMKWNLFW